MPQAKQVQASKELRYETSEKIFPPGKKVSITDSLEPASFSRMEKSLSIFSEKFSKLLQESTTVSESVPIKLFRERSLEMVSY